jgi:hypothetical protein
MKLSFAREGFRPRFLDTLPMQTHSAAGSSRTELQALRVSWLNAFRESDAGPIRAMPGNRRIRRQISCRIHSS